MLQAVSSFPAGAARGGSGLCAGQPWGAPRAPPGTGDPAAVRVAAPALSPLRMRRDLLLLPALVAPLAPPGLDLHQHPETRNPGAVFALSSLLLPFPLAPQSASLHLHYIDRNSDGVDLVLAESLFSFFFFNQIFFVSH